MTHKLKAYISLARPLNVLISILSVWTAVYITGEPFSLQILLLTGITAAFLIAGANSINDVFDVKTDRINKPDRPIPSGIISGKEGMVYSIFLLIIAFLPNLFLPVTALYIIIFAALFVVIYTPYLKSIPFWGNFIVSLITACGFLYGAAAMNKISSGYFPFIIAFSIHFLREIIKDTEYIAGDKNQRTKTLATVLPLKIVHILISIISFLIIILLPLPYIFNVFDIYYLMIILIIIEPVFIYLTFIFLKNKSYEKKLYKRGSNLLKVIMLIGLIAFIVG